MAKMGFRTFQEMVGRTDKLRFAPDPNNPKAQMLNFDRILKNALEIRPGTNIVGGSVAQIFDLEQRRVGCSMWTLALSVLTDRVCWPLAIVRVTPLYWMCGRVAYFSKV